MEIKVHHHLRTFKGCLLQHCLWWQKTGNKNKCLFTWLGGVGEIGDEHKWKKSLFPSAVMLCPVLPQNPHSLGGMKMGASWSSGWGIMVIPVPLKSKRRCLPPNYLQLSLQCQVFSSTFVLSLDPTARIQIIGKVLSASQYGDACMCFSLWKQTIKTIFHQF